MTNGVSAQSDVLVVMRMGPSNTTHHLLPLAAAVAPARVHIVRPAPMPQSLRAVNVIYHEVRSPGRLLQVAATLLVALRLAHRHEIKSIISFNAFPYGLIAAMCGLLYRKPFHVGFVGSDLKVAHRRPWWVRFILRASLITTTGEDFNRFISDLGYSGSLRHLDHGIDERRFHPAKRDRNVDVLFVGALIPRKNVRLIIEAIALAAAQRPITAVVVGDGPDRAALENLVRDLGVGDAVTFVGVDFTPERWMQRARIFAMASSWEGLPFAMIEAMRCGAVPVVTPAGSIEDLITDGRNGLLVGPAAQEMADAYLRVLEDEATFERMSDLAVSSTTHLTYAQVEEAWRGMLQEMGAPRTGS